MKILLRIFIFTFFLLSIVSAASADIIYLKNGRQLEGIITKETNDYIELKVGFGSVKFYRAEIERTQRSSEKERQKIEQAWQEERLRQESELKEREEQELSRPKEIEVSRQGSHLFVNALLNTKVNARLLVDTGASLVILSPDIAKKLNIDIQSATLPDIKLVLGDASQIPAKLIKIEVMSVEEAKATNIDAAVISKADAFPGFDGMLGMSFLRLFKFEINLEQNKLVLEKL